MDSLLLQAVRQTGELKMPPKKALTEAEVASLAAWVEAGAVWPAYDARMPSRTETVKKPVVQPICTPTRFEHGPCSNR